MKTKSILIIVFIICIKSIGWSQPVNTLIKEIAMAAPNAAALGKYGDIPVSYFTGVPNISVPIHTMQEGPLSLPVSVSYHASGIKVGETASWVGLGWSLSAGGMVTRTTLGMPDEKGAGYLNGGVNLKYPITKGYTGVYPSDWPHNGAVESDLPLINQQMRDIADGVLDGEPDLFSFNFGGYSGKFFFDKDKKINIIPKSDVKIEYSINNAGSGGTAEIYRFILTTPDGTRYIFGTLESESALSYSGVEFSYYSNIPTNDIAPTSWYLRRIESADRNYNITLAYVSESYSYKNLGSCTVNLTQGSYSSSPVTCGPIGIGLNTAVNINDIQGKRLSQITGSSGITQIDFLANTEREDLDPYTGTPSRRRLDAVEIKTPGNSAYCKKFNFSYDYFTSPGGTTSEYKRLRLLQLQESACDGTITIPAQKFTYNSGSLPNRFSKAIDHWGYNNGVTSNDGKVGIPTGTSAVWFSGVTTPAYANSDRESSESNMLIGALQKIEYPTSGYTEFTYEANDYLQNSTSIISTVIFGDVTNCTYPQTSCCNTYQASGSRTFTASELTNAQFKLTLYNLNINPYKYCNIGNSNPPSPSVQVIVAPTSGGPGIGSYSFNINNTQSTVEMIKPLSFLNQTGTLQSGVSYTFTVYVSHGKGAFNIFRDSTISVPINKKVGGLRIKEIKNHDNVSAANDIIKRYKYTNNGSTNSSGVLYQMPEYVGYQKAWDGSTLGVTFHANSIIPLSSANGYHIAYNRVEEEQVGNGKSVFLFYNEFNTQQIQQTYPTVPEEARVKDGHQDAAEVYNQAGIKLASTINTLNVDNYTYTPGIMYRAYKFQFWDAALGLYTNYLYAKPFSLRTAASREMQVQSTIDGVTTTTTYTYDGLSRHLAPTAIAMTNSDNKITTTHHKYVHDWAVSPLRDTMIARNMIGMPVETTIRVGSDTLSGSKTEYSFYDNNTGLPTSTAANNHPYPYKFYNYERTWTGGALQLGSWPLQGTIDSYYPNSNANAKGYPKQFTKINWSPETYEWNKGLITKRTYSNFNWIYNYHAGTRLLSSITDIDGQVSSFAYDKLSRLKTTTARSGNVITNYTYQYKDGSNPRNYVKTVTDYTASSQSSLTQRGMVQYLDGLGRPLQDIKIKHNPSTGPNEQSLSTVDVIVNYEYDNQGRLIKSTNPYTSTYQDGTYYAPPGGTPFTQTQYESSPLNRVTSVTPPNWYATTTAYGKNTGTITVPGGTAYAANTLMETKVTDPDNRVSFTYTDKKGRVIMTRQTDTGNTSPAETYNVYDDKDRLEKVVPPSATLSTPELIFTYEYSGDDLLLKKKIPGAALVNMKYNNRDLLTFTQDGNLLALTKSMAVKYDLYGRPTETGFLNGTMPSDPNAAFTFSEVLSKSFYDGYDGSGQLDLITFPQYRGKVRRSEAKVLGSSSTFLYTLFGYDSHGRLTNTNGNNYLNTGSASAESVSMSYDWADNKTTDNRTHNPGAGAATTSHTLNTQLWYDHMGRNTEYLLDLNGDNTHLGRYVYNHKDEIIERNLASNFTAGTYGWLQSVDYTYNDLGWLTKMNTNAHVGTASAFPASGCTPALPNPGSPARVKFPEDNDLFYMELRYDQPFDNTTAGGNITGITGFANQKAGNISQIAWRTRGRERQAYNFSYDHLSRLTAATYHDVNGSNNATATNRFNESLTYDLRGNISSLQRQGYYSSGCNYGQIDNLTYTYNPTYPNRVQSISDAAPSSQKSHGFNPGSGTGSYSYDVNGNMTADPYKGITSIAYNYLNLPNLITFSSGNTIEYVYDAAGMKLRKIVKVGATVQYEQDYIGDLEYRKNGAGSKRIEAVYHAEGRYLNLNAEVNNILFWQKEYSIKDYLGNARISFTDKNANGIVDVPSDITQENHYYPFGLNYEGPWKMNDAVAKDSRYQFSNKEWNDDFGLNWNDHGARFYDSAIARWWVIDSKAQKYSPFSPYNYAINNPLKFIDPDGKEIVIRLDPKAAKDKKFIEQALSALQALTNDRLGRDPSTGKIHVLKSNVANAGKKLSVGTLLVRELIKDDNVVTIQNGPAAGSNPLDENGKEITNPDEIEKGKEYNTLIRFKSGHDPNTVNEDGTEGGKPDFISLGHELFHGNHNGKGENDQTKLPNHIDPDSRSLKTKGQVSKEEYRTRNEENKLRDEHQVKRRAIPYEKN